MVAILCYFVVSANRQAGQGGTHLAILLKTPLRDFGKSACWGSFVHRYKKGPEGYLPVHMETEYKDFSLNALIEHPPSGVGDAIFLPII